MILRDPISLIWLLITLLALVFSGELFSVFLAKTERDCHRRNVWLFGEQKQGPRQECE